MNSFEIEKLKTINFFDNKIFLYVSKPLHEDDIELISLYFQANHYSGGDDIIESHYDREKNLIEINYLKNVTKQEILKRHRFSYRGYVFKAFEARTQNYHSNFVRMRNTLIIDNMTKSETLDDIGIYINCIVKNSIIFKIEYSNILDNKIYVEFKDSNLDFDEIRSNLAKRPTFRNNFVKVYEAYETNAVLMKIQNANIKNFVDYLNKNFMIKDQCYWQVPFDFEDSPFIIIKFKNGQAKQRFILGFTASDIKDVFIENLCNIQMLNDYLQKFKNLKNKESELMKYNNNSVNDWNNGELTIFESKDSRMEIEMKTNSYIPVEKSMLKSLIEDESLKLKKNDKHDYFTKIISKRKKAREKKEKRDKMNATITAVAQSVNNNVETNKTMTLNDIAEEVTRLLNVDPFDFHENEAVFNSFTANNDVSLITQKTALKRRIKPRDYPKSCAYCPYVAHQASAYAKHLKHHEYNPNTYKCRYCSFNADKRIALCSHLSLHNIKESESEKIK